MTDPLRHSITGQRVELHRRGGFQERGIHFRTGWRDEQGHDVRRRCGQISVERSSHILLQRLHVADDHEPAFGEHGWRRQERQQRLRIDLVAAPDVAVEVTRCWIHDSVGYLTDHLILQIVVIAVEKVRAFERTALNSLSEIAVRVRCSHAPNIRIRREVRTQKSPRLVERNRGDCMAAPMVRRLTSLSGTVTAPDWPA